VDEGLSGVRPTRLTDSYAIAAWKGLVVWVVDGHTPLEELERLRVVVRDWMRERGSAKNVSLVVIHANSTTMSGEERRTVAKIVEDTKSSRIASANVVVSSGVVAALHRSILTGLSLLVPPPHPVKVFANVSPAIRFLHPYIEALCGRVAPEEIEAFVARLHGEVLARRHGATGVASKVKG
jgi:hypothetical protein